jgi:uncharacterized damage-inducible protein DinB
MRVAEATTLIDHLYWVRDRVLEQAAAAGDALVSESPTTTRDLRTTLVHELDVQWSWRERLRGADWDAWGPDAELKGEDYPSVEAIAEHWRRDEIVMRDWLASLADADLDASPVRDEDRQPLWCYVMHLYAHGLQQFSEAAVLLTGAGYSPGEIGFLEFVFTRENGGRRQG